MTSILIIGPYIGRPKHVRSGAVLRNSAPPMLSRKSSRTTHRGEDICEQSWITRLAHVCLMITVKLRESASFPPSPSWSSSSSKGTRSAREQIWFADGVAFLYIALSKNHKGLQCCIGTIQKAGETLRGFIYWTVHKRIRMHVSEKNTLWPCHHMWPYEITEWTLQFIIFSASTRRSIVSTSKKIALFCSFATEWLLSSFPEAIIDLNFSF